MSEAELKEKVERALHARITAAEWEALRDAEMLKMFEAGGYVSWEDFKDDVASKLDQLRRFLQNTEREQAGELPLETEVSEKAVEPTSTVDIPTLLSKRTAARIGALNALDQLRLGPKAWGRVIREISSRVRPQVDSEALPQWVIELEIEAWVPAEDVRSIYEHVQRDLLAEEARPKNPPRTFEVAQYVWEEELRFGGKRPSWPALLEHWNERNPEKQFKSWRAFRTCFKRGEKATPPQYKQSNDYIASEAREHIASEARRLRRRLQHLPE